MTGLVSIVERLDLKVIAKGVETREQREFPGELDCENAGLYHPDDGKSVLDAAPGLQPNPGSAAAAYVLVSVDSAAPLSAFERGKLEGTGCLETVKAFAVFSMITLLCVDPAVRLRQRVTIRFRRAKTGFRAFPKVRIGLK